MLLAKSFNSILDLLNAFPDEQSCINHLETTIWSDVPISPFDKTSKVYKCKNNRYMCTNTNKYFTIKTNKIFEGTQLPLQKWFIAIYLLTTSKKGISSIQLSEQVGVTQKTAWFMDHRIRKALKQNNGQLFGTVELDETYIGGKEKNKHLSKRVKGTQGRNTLTKTPVMGLLQRGGEIKANVIENVKMRTLEKQIVEHVKIGSQLYTDEFLSYSQIGSLYPHKSVCHSKGQYVNVGNVHSNGAESFWAILKRGHYGIYHSMSKKHLQLYADEFVYRFNNRKSALVDIFSDVVQRVSDSKKMPYKTLIA